MSDPTALVQFGVLGVILMLVLFGYLWAKPAVDEIKAQVITERTGRERAEAQRDSLIETYQTEVLPTLRAASEGTTRVVALAELTGSTLAQTEKVLGEVKVLLLQKGAT